MCSPIFEAHFLIVLRIIYLENEAPQKGLFLNKATDIKNLDEILKYTVGMATK